MLKAIKQLIVGPIATNCWICQIDDKNAAVIDPGEEADVIASVLKELSLFPKFILLTHGHFDHIAAISNEQLTMNNERGTMSNERVQIAIHKADACYLGKGAFEAHSRSIEAAMGDASFIDEYFPSAKEGLPEADILLEEGSVIFPFTVLHLSGHTPGSCAFWDKERKILFSGDTLFKDGFGRTDLPGGNEKDLIASIRRLFSMDKDITVCPGHGGVTTIGKEAG